MPWTTPETFTAGQTLTAASMNIVSGNLSYLYDDYARGVMGYVTKTTDQNGVGTSATDISGLSVTFTAESARLYRVSMNVSKMVQNTNQAYAYLAIADASNNNKAWWQQLVNATEEASGHASFLVTGISGSTTYKGRIYTSNATIDLKASSNQPTYLLVEDIGAA